MFTTELQRAGKTLDTHSYFIIFLNLQVQPLVSHFDLSHNHHKEHALIG